jgi:HAD superfamily hydrolase (TIGR01509 family)
VIKAAIFDVDGTLVDSVDAHARSWVETFSEFGKEVGFSEMRHQIGKGGDQLMREFLTEEEIRKLGKSIEEARGRLFQQKYLPGVEGFPRTRDLFERILGDGKRIALASSANGKELDAYKEKAHITDLVDAETSKDDVEKSKPHPDIFDAALARLPDIQRHEVIVIGDTPWDAIAARRAGMKMIGVLCGGFSATELRSNGCMALYRDPADLLSRYTESVLAR